ncbi:MAG: hypothetical protein Q7T95_09600 [Hydrogenophaga sp.]|nr:hypothetical protein [Hydrogenophaga sp.]
MFVYKISGRQPGFTDGVMFNSCVRNLQGQPDLWLDECPYLHPLSSTVTDGLRVELISAIGDAAPRTTPVALAA